MSKKIVQFLCVSLICVIGCLSCSKYEEGPGLSFRSKESRLIGLWELSSLKKNGIDYAGTYKADSVYMRFSIIKYDDLFINMVKTNRHGSQYSSSLLTFEKNHTQLRFYLKQYAAYIAETNPIYELIPPLGKDVSWEILELKSREFILTITDEDIVYRLTFSNIEKY